MAFIDNILPNNEEPELPVYDSLEEALDAILPKIRPWSEDLSEEDFFVGKPWMEIRDDDNFHSAILYFFNPGGEYMFTIDGNVRGNSWRMMEDGSNRIILPDGKGNVLFDLAYLDNDFFILKRHGYNHDKKYFVLGSESVVKKLQWNDVVDLLASKYQETSSSYVGLVVAIVVVVIAIFIMFSFL